MKAYGTFKVLILEKKDVDIAVRNLYQSIGIDYKDETGNGQHIFHAYGPENEIEHRHHFVLSQLRAIWSLCQEHDAEYVKFM